ncbi:hypothetical protein MRX96_052190, partial [Rhipicephalus microplus]
MPHLIASCELITCEALSVPGLRPHLESSLTRLIGATERDQRGPIYQEDAGTQRQRSPDSGGLLRGTRHGHHPGHRVRGDTPLLALSLHLGSRGREG